jgi:hypothetical protein
MNKEHQPLHELPTELPDPCRYGDIAWQLDIPNYVPEPKRIALNGTFLTIASRLSGFSGVVISGYEGETSDIMGGPTSVVSLGANGMATGAGTASMTKTETVKSDLEEGGDDLQLRDYNWPILNLQLNKAEIKSRVETNDLPVTEAYTDEVNSAMRKGYLTAAKENLLPLRRDTKYGLEAHVKLFSSLVCLTGPLSLAEVHAFSTAFNSIQLELETGSSQLHRKRWSAFIGPCQPDRLALAAIALHTQPFLTVDKKV